MKRFFNPFVLTLSTLAAALYAYLALRVATGAVAWAVLAVPFLLIWAVPVFYWFGPREERSPLDEFIHGASFVGMGWLNFAILLSLLRDVLQFSSGFFPALAGLHHWLAIEGGTAVLTGSFMALGLGMLFALRGPGVMEVKVPIAGLDPRLHGLRIAQISDLHVGPTIRKRFVDGMVAKAAALKPDFFALTGDIIDGSVPRLAPELASLGELPKVAPAYFVTGNHEYYSGAAAWIEHFTGLGIRALQNENALLTRNGATVLVGGVNDPTAARFDKSLKPDAERAIAGGAGAAVKLLLAHNPKFAPHAAQAGFDLMLSGHTHGGQFFPWTLAVRYVHAPHITGLSREGRMQVYVSAGTGSWGPPVRFGTRTEISLITLVAA